MDYAPMEPETAKQRRDRICGHVITGLVALWLAASWAAVCHLMLLELAR